MKRSRSLLKHLSSAGIKGKKNKNKNHALKNNHTSNRKSNIKVVHFIYLLFLIFGVYISLSYFSFRWFDIHP